VLGCVYDDPTSKITLPCCSYECCASCLLQWFDVHTETACPSCNFVLLYPQVTRLLGPRATEWRAKHAKTLARAHELVPHTVVALAEITRYKAGPEPVIVKALAAHEKRLVQQLKDLQAAKKLTDEMRVPLPELMAKPQSNVALMATLVPQLQDASLSGYKAVELITRAIADAPKDVPTGKPARCTLPGCTGQLSAYTNLCYICRQQLCIMCHEMYKFGTEHTCNQVTLQSLQAIESNYRACPTCSARIERIDGCTHMLCTACGCDFDWATGLFRSSDPNHPMHEHMLPISERDFTFRNGYFVPDEHDWPRKFPQCLLGAILDTYCFFDTVIRFVQGHE
jgi:hypothetical protein